MPQDDNRWAHEPARAPDHSGGGAGLKAFLPTIATPGNDGSNGKLFAGINNLRGSDPSSSELIAQLAEDRQFEEPEDEHDGPEYNNTLCAKLAKNKYFEYTTLAIIGLNSMWIGYDTDANDSDELYDADMQFVIAENFFCFYFTFEVLVRLVAFKNKLDIFRLPPPLKNGEHVIKVRFFTSGLDYQKLSGASHLLSRVIAGVRNACSHESGLPEEHVQAELSENSILVTLAAKTKAGELKSSIAAASDNYTLAVKDALNCAEVDAVTSGALSVTRLTLAQKVTKAGDFWIKFDFLLVVMMISETWILPFAGGSGPLANMATLRLLRLLRITRMARLMRSVPELMTIVRGMMAATRTVVSTLLLLVLITYVFSIIFTGQFHDSGLCDTLYNAFDDDGNSLCEEIIEMGSEAEGDIVAIHGYFGSMQKTMMTLFVQGTLLDDVTDVVFCLLNVSAPALVVYLIFILISSFTMLNMLIGILVEVVQAEAAGEKNKAKMGQVQDLMDSVFKGMDEDGSGKISLDEFKQMSENPAVVDCLKALDIAPKHLKAYQDILFPSGEEMLNFKEFMSHLFRLRPGTAASVLDIEHFRKDLSDQMDKISEHIERHVSNLEIRFGATKRKDNMAGTGGKRFTRAQSMRTGGYRKSASAISGRSDTSSTGSREVVTASAGAREDHPTGSTLRVRSSSPPPEPPKTSKGDTTDVANTCSPAKTASPLIWSERDALEMLENTPSSEILRELTRRLGNPAVAAPASQTPDFHSVEPFQGRGVKLEGPPAVS